MNDKQDSRFKIYQHDARNLKSYLGDEFDDTNGLVDTIITSPPYADLVDYGDHEEQIGKQSYEEFLDDLRSIFKQCYDIASEDCTLWIVTDTFRSNGRVVRLPFDIADELENLQNHDICLEQDCSGYLEQDRENGSLECSKCGAVHNPLPESWRMEDNIIWDKTRTRPWTRKGQLRNVHEYVTVFSKSDGFTYNKDAIRVTDPDEFQRWWVNYPERYSPRGIVPSNVWRFPIPKQGQWGPKVSYHPSPFPEELVERIVRLASDPGDVVFDPFAGIGTTLAVVEALDRKPLGFELNQEYIEYYQKHVRPAALREVGSVQSTLRDEQSILQKKIYTLRIHKYAYKLYKQLIEGENSSIRRGQIKFIQAISDPNHFDAESKPDVRLEFVHEPSNNFEEISFETVMESMLSEKKGSGDYYGVEFHPEFITLRDYLSNLESGSPELIGNKVHLYQDGNHHWAEETLSLDEWINQITDEEWLQYWSKSHPPLVSNLKIQVDNPLEERKEKPSSQQSELGSF
ncbi:site-specific DNA-methyltransferase (plasmid) [Halococcus dombrowskii]|uniref:site-specific DNA-methyltransferase (cytosine-N(4)-specific) n=1 Tax=Halococcus dombrowskii TaxID=179637 RepID=A0AAV3SEA1_HALDO|nr:site-specific DNA-methyltransferase [Halococcus dombrowskii]UOO96915.1 site-specific DNA-methyltransferase [Halococcus dombrowskii]